ncbi:hypothetical protein [Gelidibacter sp.]|uniref:hypothetical protein n=1 Tax=Gelidibacter sp. TaxID=2018083 RepID=UPI0032631E4B
MMLKCWSRTCPSVQASARIFLFLSSVIRHPSSVIHHPSSIIHHPSSVIGFC